MYLYRSQTKPGLIFLMLVSINNNHPAGITYLASRAPGYFGRLVGQMYGLIPINPASQPLVTLSIPFTMATILS
jgi:hypothetical protein